jgi:hypothetical protein
MTYTASREDVKSVLEWLYSSDQSQWEDQTKRLVEAIYDFERMGHPLRHPDNTGTRSQETDFHSPEANAINVAMPQLKNMLSAMQSRDRVAAIESGEAAVALLPEGA